MGTGPLGHGCSTEAGGNCTPRRPLGDATVSRKEAPTAAYLARFEADAPMVSSHAMGLEEHHHHSTSCCEAAGELLVPNDRELVNPSYNQAFSSDLVSLACAKSGDESLCSEIFRSVCVVNPPAPSAVVDLGSHDNAHIAEPFVVPGPSWVNDSAVRDRQRLPEPLTVPIEFQGIEYDWTAPSSANAVADLSSLEQRDLLEGCVKHFARSLHKGVRMQLEFEDGQDASAGATTASVSPVTFGSSMMSSVMSGGSIGSSASRHLDAAIAATPDLSVLVLSSGKVERSVSIRSVRAVKPCPPASNWRSWWGGDEQHRVVILRLAGGAATCRIPADGFTAGPFS